MSPLERHIATLKALRQQVDDELAQLLGRPSPSNVKRSRKVLPECGSESAYQRHRHYRDTATESRTVTCQPCLEGHRQHEAIRKERARLQEVISG